MRFLLSSSSSSSDYFSIRAVHLYRSTMIVERSFLGRSVPFDGRPSGADIRFFSSRSRARLAWLVSETSVQFVTFSTLTYPSVFPSDGRQVKRHLNNFLTKLRQKFPGVNYLWFIEFQRRGAPHFHILLDIPTSDARVELWARWWADISARGLSAEEWRKVYQVHHRRGFEPVKKKDGAVRYALKYSLKTYQKEVPKDFRNIGRFWGASRGVKQSVGEPFTRFTFPDYMTESEKIAYINDYAGSNFDADFLPSVVFVRGNDDND